MQEIDRIRAFNRTVTRRLGVLNERYLGRNRPLVESRLLFEIGTQGASIRELRTRLGLDSGFSSRLLRSLERKKLLRTERAGSDGRVRIARLTRSGLAELERINSLSDDLAHSMLAPLSPDQAKRLVAAMGEVDRLMRASSVEFAPVDFRSARCAAMPAQVLRRACGKISRWVRAARRRCAGRGGDCSARGLHDHGAAFR